jgi:hypothetical protein
MITCHWQWSSPHDTTFYHGANTCLNMAGVQDFFVNCISAISGVAVDAKTIDLDAFASFLNDPACLLLRAKVYEGGDLALSTTILAPFEDRPIVHEVQFLLHVAELRAG